MLKNYLVLIVILGDMVQSVALKSIYQIYNVVLFKYSFVQFVTFILTQCSNLVMGADLCEKFYLSVNNSQFHLIGTTTSLSCFYSYPKSLFVLDSVICKFLIWFFLRTFCSLFLVQFYIEIWMSQIFPQVYA